MLSTSDEKYLHARLTVSDYIFNGLTKEVKRIVAAVSRRFADHGRHAGAEACKQGIGCI
jgi:hypothetical protein